MDKLQDYALSLVIPCYNEEKTLEQCVNNVLELKSTGLKLDIIIVDDASKDGSAAIAENLEKAHAEITLIKHEVNKGKGAALRTGFKKAAGDFVAVQDADLEYNPMELKDLLVPLIRNEADVVFGSRFLSSGAHRVLYYWHSLGNRVLTMLSNMLTDLNLTDMETCYKVFKREVIQSIELEEDRFGFEPEITAKVAHMRLRIFEMGISYYGRTYEEGKKIGLKDGIRALYCIVKYNGFRVPLPLQFLFYIFIGGLAGLANLAVFLLLFHAGYGVCVSAPAAFGAAALLNYLLCIKLLFKRGAKWRTATEALIYSLIVAGVGALDLFVTKHMLGMHVPPVWSKLYASGVVMIFNFLGRRYFVFPSPVSGPWNPQKK